ERSPMHEIVCPHCGKAFTIDEAGYADIVKQVRDREFQQELHARLEAAEKDKAAAVELTKATVAAELEKSAAAKDAEIARLKAEAERTARAQQLAVKEAVAELDRARDDLAGGLKSSETEQRVREASLQQQ